MKRKVELAPTHKVDTYRIETDEVLRHIALMMKEPEESEEEWLNYAFVSDESRVGDFFYQDSELIQLRARLGIPDLTSKDLICDVAALLRNKKQPY